MGFTGVVHIIVVDDAGFEQPTQLRKMLPVTAIPREPRCIRAQHSADLARAQPRHQAIKAGARTVPLADRPRQVAAQTLAALPAASATASGGVERGFDRSPRR